MPRGNAYTEKQIEKALIAASGKITIAAEKLQCDYSTIARRVKQNPKLQAIVKRELESLVDLAEIMIKRAIMDREAWAICFTLKCQGKSRGWIERPPLDQGLIAAGGVQTVNITNVDQDTVIQALLALDKLKIGTQPEQKEPEIIEVEKVDGEKEDLFK